MRTCDAHGKLRSGIPLLMSTLLRRSIPSSRCVIFSAVEMDHLQLLCQDSDSFHLNAAVCLSTWVISSTHSNLTRDALTSTVRALSVWDAVL